MTQKKSSSPPDLGVNVGESVKTAESGGAMSTEKNPHVLNLWITQAFQDIDKAILIYILKNHPNADANTVRELLGGRIKHQTQGHQ